MRNQFEFNMDQRTRSIQRKQAEGIVKGRRHKLKVKLRKKRSTTNKINVLLHFKIFSRVYNCFKK